MKRLFFTFFFAISTSVLASDTIVDLKIEQDIVYFTTAIAKQGTRPSCVASEHLEQWAFSLQTPEGRNLYRALLSANAAGKAIDVTSALDCRDVASYERPVAIAMQLL